MTVLFKKTEKVERVDPSKYDCPPSVTASIKLLRVSYTYEGDVGQIKFYACAPRDCDEYAQVAGTILQMLRPHRRCSGAAIRAEVLLCPCEKQMPRGDEVIGMDHVNTGYAQRCSAAPFVVYREDEWVKVFIHECFHYFNLDENMDEVALPMFQVRQKVALYETYCEVWARLLNCRLVAAFTGLPVAKLIHEERRYSVYNMVKVLAHMGLTFGDLATPAAARYAEATNVFAYIVLAAILMNDPAAFEAEFRGFRGSNAQIVSMVSQQMGSASFLTEVKRQEANYERLTKWPQLRMSIIDLFYLLNV